VIGFPGYGATDAFPPTDRGPAYVRLRPGQRAGGLWKKGGAHPGNEAYRYNSTTNQCLQGIVHVLRKNVLYNGYNIAQTGILEDWNGGGEKSHRKSGVTSDLPPQSIAGVGVPTLSGVFDRYSVTTIDSIGDLHFRSVTRSVTDRCIRYG
jgi:hypothetical protein